MEEKHGNVREEKNVPSAGALALSTSCKVVARMAQPCLLKEEGYDEELGNSQEYGDTNTMKDIDTLSLFFGIYIHPMGPTGLLSIVSLVFTVG